MLLLGIVSTIGLVSRSVESGTVAYIALTTSLGVLIGGLLLCITALMMHILNNHPTLRRLASYDNA